MDDFIGFLISTSVSVVLPVMIVWLIQRTYVNRTNKRSEIMMEIVKTRDDVDVNELTNMFSRERRNPKEVADLRLLRASIFSLLGVAFGIIGIIASVQNWSEAEDWVITATVCSLIFFAIGISYGVVYFVTKKRLKEDCN